MQRYHAQLGPVQVEAEVLPSDPDMQVARTLEIMAGYSNSDSSDSRIVAISRAIRQSTTTPFAYCRAVWEVVNRLVRFNLDAEVQAGVQGLSSWVAGEGGEIVEVLVRPIDLLTAKEPVGDCDDFSMLCAALLLAGGIPCCFCTVSADGSGNWSHVYTVAYPLGHRLALDASHGEYPGWETTHNHKKKEWKMLVPINNQGTIGENENPDGLGIDWSFIKDTVTAGITTAGNIFRTRYSVPEAPPPGTVYRAPDGTVISSGVGPGIVQGPGLDIGVGGISTGTILLVGVLLFGFSLMNRR